MKNLVEFCLVLVIAFVLYAVSGNIFFLLPQLINFFTLAVIYFALSKGEVYAALMGTACGFVQDCFSLGIFGVSGLAKTITGYLAGMVSQRTNVFPFFRNFLFIFIFTSIEIMISSFMYYVIASQYVKEVRSLMLLQPGYTVRQRIM